MVDAFDRANILGEEVILQLASVKVRDMSVGGSDGGRGRGQARSADGGGGRRRRGLTVD